MKRLTDRDSAHQLGALITLLLLALWGLGVLWIHLVTPAGADAFEMTYVGTVTGVLLLLLPLYWRRIRWAYVGGVLVVLALFVGTGKGALDQSLIFSWSLYNVGVILAYAVALGCAYLSIRAYRELPSVGPTRTLLGAAGIVVAAAAIAAVLWLSRDGIRSAMWRMTLNRIDNRLQRLETLDEQIQFLVDEGDLASAAAGIVVDDALVWAEAYGEAEVDTVYDIGSVTKPLVATAVLQLHERGLIDLDDDVNAYLPFPLRHPLYPDNPITIRMLLAHQSGLAHFTDRYYGYHTGEATADWLTENQGWDLPSFAPYPAFAEFMAGYLTAGGAYYTPDAWTANRPGTGYSYSTIGYDILPTLVESVSGRPFAEYAREEIFEPLGMTGSGFSIADFPGRVARPYERMYGVLSKTNVEMPLEDVRTIGGGGMLSTVPDLAQFMVAHLNQGRAGGVELLQPETVALMHERAVTFPVGRADLNQDASGLGLGHIRDEPWNAWGHPYDMHGATGHGGSWFGYQSQMWFVEEEGGGYGIVLLINTEFDFKAEARALWLFASPLRLQVLLMEEAATRYAQVSGQ